MKHNLFVSLPILLALMILSSCDPIGNLFFNKTFRAGKVEMSFSADGGKDETSIVNSSNKPVKGKTGWSFSQVYIVDEKNNFRDIVLQDKEEELPNGTYMVDAGWAKFYYPKKRNKIRVEVAPNPNKEMRKLIFDGGGGPVYYIKIVIKQAGKTD